MARALNRPTPATIADIVEGLLLFDEPMLNSRYHSLLARDQNATQHHLLQKLPGFAIRSHQLAHAAVQDWMRTAKPLDDVFIRKGNRVILESFLTLVENQLGLIAFMARSAPTHETRTAFDEMADIHRAMATELRAALNDMTSAFVPELHPLRSVQEEGPIGDLRGQVERAIRARLECGSGIRRVILSHTAQRHLRDQGCFREGDTTLLGAPVVIDFSWESPAFAIQGYDVLPLEEVRGGVDFGQPEKP